MRFLGLEIKRVLTTRLTWILLSVAILCPFSWHIFPVTFEQLPIQGSGDRKSAKRCGCCEIFAGNSRRPGR